MDVSSGKMRKEQKRDVSLREQIEEESEEKRGITVTK